MFELLHGIPEYIVDIVVFIPLTVLVLNIVRYILGFKTLGLYPVVVMTLAYILLGVQLGILMTIVVFISSIISNKFFASIRLHYNSKLGLVYTVVSFSTFIIFYITKYILYLDIVKLVNTEMLTIGIVLLTTLSDPLYKVYLKKNIFTISTMLLETLVVSSFIAYLVNYTRVTSAIFNSIWGLPVIVILIITIGKLSTIRITELLRFYQIIFRKRD